MLGRRRRRGRGGSEGGRVCTHTCGNCRLCWPCQSQFLFGGAFQSAKQTDLTPAMLHDCPLLPPSGVSPPSKCICLLFMCLARCPSKSAEASNIQEAHANLAIVFGIEIGFGNEEREIEEGGEWSSPLGNN